MIEDLRLFKIFARLVIITLLDYIWLKSTKTLLFIGLLLCIVGKVLCRVRQSFAEHFRNIWNHTLLGLNYLNFSWDKIFFLSLLISDKLAVRTYFKFNLTGCQIADSGRPCTDLAPLFSKHSLPLIIFDRSSLWSFFSWNFASIFRDLLCAIQINYFFFLFVIVSAHIIRPSSLGAYVIIFAHWAFVAPARHNVSCFILKNLASVAILIRVERFAA